MRSFACRVVVITASILAGVETSSAVQVKFEGDGFATLSPSIWAGQLDSDPALEVIMVVGTHNVVIRDGATGTVELNIPFTGTLDPNNIAATFADVDGDGAVEAIICVTHGAIGTGPGGANSHFWVIDGAPALAESAPSGGSSSDPHDPARVDASAAAGSSDSRSGR